MATNGKAPFGISNNINLVGRIDLPGGGSIVVEDGYAYVGHIEPPFGTSIVDVRDPKHPRLVAQLEVPEGVHSHKVRVRGDVMMVNYERFKTDKQPQVGLKIFDISDKTKPREIAFFKAAGKGVHRFTIDDRYVYFSPAMEGYLGNIVMTVDLKDPRNPEEVGRWWLPGQWAAGGETPAWEETDHRCHHPIRRGDRLYVSYWHGGFVILDISDMTRPKMLSHLDWSPPYPCPTHTTLPMPEKIMGRDVMIVTDEEVRARLSPKPFAFLWVVDITEETRPIPISTFMVPHDGESGGGNWFGAHQPAEQVYGNILYVTWFAGGLRAVDFSNPYSPKEVGFYVPMPGKGQKAVQSNDVYHRDDGLLFLVDRLDGLEILESRV
ncbi:MAG: LVIVD repeat-containing protein [Candidatus Binatia bacterium]